LNFFTDIFVEVLCLGSKQPTAFTDVVGPPACTNCRHVVFAGEPGSSVSIVSGYCLDDRAIEVRSPEEAKDFS
jgi:hypothetical protein